MLGKLLDDLEQGQMRGVYKSERLHPWKASMPPRYDLLKRHRYVNSTFVQTSRGCHQGCTFCAEPLMNGLKFRYRPVDEVIREVERLRLAHDLDQRRRLLRHAGPAEGGHAGLQGTRLQLAGGGHLEARAGRSHARAGRGQRLHLLSIGFESITRSTLTSVHKHVNRPETFASLVEKVHSYGIMVFGLFMFGFDGDDPTVFQETAHFNIDADYDACAYSVLTPYPGTLTWYELKKADRIVSFDWDDVRPGQRGLRPAR